MVIADIMIRPQILSPTLQLLMASSEVDQKFLGKYAQQVNNTNPFLSSWLYKVLGLSVILSKKLIRARRLRKLDTTRDTKSLQLYHHIIWLSREGLVMVEQYIVPMTEGYVELKVLAHKLRASFYHIFVLFHNQPSVNQTAIPSYTPNKGKGVDRNSLRSSPNPMEGGPVKMPSSLPPGLAPVSIPKPSASFLLPAADYIPTASRCFQRAAMLCDTMLSGSHPLRLSVKTEFSAYVYDCLHDGDASRRIAQQAIRDVYNAQEGMDDEMFEDAAELVAILGKFMKRGLKGSDTSSTPKVGSASTPETPRERRYAKETGGSTPNTGETVVPARGSPRTRESPRVAESSMIRESPRSKESPRTTDSPKTKESPRSRDSPRTKDSPRVRDSPRTKDSPKTRDSPRSKESPRTRDDPRPRTRDDSRMRDSPKGKSSSSRARGGR